MNATLVLVGEDLSHEVDAPVMTPREVRVTDRPTFVIQVVVLIASVAISASTGVAATLLLFRSDNTQLHSDVRDILTKMDAQAKISEMAQKLIEAQMSALKGQMEGLQRAQTLQQIDLQNLKETVLTSKGRAQ